MDSREIKIAGAFHSSGVMMDPKVVEGDINVISVWTSRPDDGNKRELSVLANMDNPAIGDKCIFTINNVPVVVSAYDAVNDTDSELNKVLFFAPDIPFESYHCIVNGG